MKKTLVVIGLLLSVIVVLIAREYVTVFKTKTFATSTARNDTSALINLKGYEFVELQTSVTGTDSVKLIYYIDSYMNGQYDLAAKQDSLIIDNGSGDYAKGLLIRGYGTNNIPGAEYIRIRTRVQSGGTDDSSSATSYTQYLILR